MAETPQKVSADDLLRERALKEMSKPPRVKTETIVIAVAEFVNGGASTYKHFEQKYPTATVSKLKNIIRENKVFQGRVYPVKDDEFGITLVNVTPKPAA